MQIRHWLSMAEPQNPVKESNLEVAVPRRVRNSSPGEEVDLRKEGARGKSLINYFEVPARSSSQKKEKNSFLFKVRYRRFVGLGKG